MRSLSRAYRRWTPATIGVLLLLGCGLLGLVGLPEYPSARRVDAQSRWSTRPFSSYQIAVRVEYGGNTCMQTIETQEISERLEHPAPCYAAGQTCSCYRIRSGEIAYDAHLGYPRLIAYRREVRPNLVHVEFWRRLWETRQLPRCGPALQEVTITITSLNPLR